MTSPPRPPSAQIIQSYGNGGFTVSGERHAGPLIVLRGRILAWTPPDDLAALALEDFAPVLGPAAEADIILLGCGPRAVQVSAKLRAELRAAGVTLELMDSGAACRTFNLLQIEGRRVAAMLIALP